MYFVVTVCNTKRHYLLLFITNNQQPHRIVMPDINSNSWVIRHPIRPSMATNDHRFMTTTSGGQQLWYWVYVMFLIVIGTVLLAIIHLLFVNRNSDNFPDFKSKTTKLFSTNNNLKKCQQNIYSNI